jgi:hypothetical protein
VSWPTPIAYLWSWPSTDLAGYRTMRVGASTITIPSAYQAWPDFIDSLNTQLGAVSWAAAHDSLGRVVLTGSSSALTWVDRLGWLLGMDKEPLTGEGATTSMTSRVPPPGALPLLGATWSEVDIKRERRLTLDRYQRGHGYVWGSARVWRWSLTMHHAAVTQLQTGWCMRGKVTISPVVASAYSGATAWSGSNADGYLEGHVVGLESIEWRPGPARELADVSLLVATQGP